MVRQSVQLCCVFLAGFFTVTEATTSLFRCDFDRGTCGMVQADTDTFNWTRHSTYTPSERTGPTRDVNGTGHYIYLESSKANEGDYAVISTPPGVLGGMTSKLYFRYHMLGEDIGTLSVSSTDCDGKDTVHWKREGSAFNQSRMNDKQYLNKVQSTWSTESLHIPASAIRVDFRADRGSVGPKQHQGDIALDDIVIEQLNGGNSTTSVAACGAGMSQGESCGAKTCPRRDTELCCDNVCCKATELRCGRKSPLYGCCLPDNLKCDGIKHCPDGEDELVCGRFVKCDDPSTKFQCGDEGRCLLGVSVCDKYPDCKDGVDETYAACVWAKKDVTKSAMRRQLLEDYDKTATPVRGDRILTVILDLNIEEIDNLDEKEQTLNTIAVTNISWTDQHFHWNLTKAVSYQSLTMQILDIWNPDITVRNSADPDIRRRRLMEKGKGNAQVYHNTGVTYTALVFLSTACDINPQMFPFDEQHCSIELYSTTESEFQYECGSMTYTNTDESPWEIINGSMICENSSDRFSVNLSLRRRPYFHLIMLVGPLVTMTILIPLVFLLPVESGEKIGFSVTVLLTLAVFQLLLGDAMPHTAQVPLLGTFLLMSMVVAALSTVLAFIIVNCHFSCCARRPARILLCGAKRKVFEAKYFPGSGSEDADAHEALVREEWVMVARRCDVCLFICFTLAVVIVVVSIWFGSNFGVLGSATSVTVD